MITGFYTASGYTIYSDDEPIYSAGNSRHDSQVYLPAHSPDALPLKVIKQYCEQTAADLADERNEQLGRYQYGNPA